MQKQDNTVPIKIKRNNASRRLINLTGDILTTDSLIVAQKFKKQHKHVLEKIENIIQDDTDGRLNFRPFLIYQFPEQKAKKIHYESPVFFNSVYELYRQKSIEVEKTISMMPLKKWNESYSIGKIHHGSKPVLKANKAG